MCDCADCQDKRTNNAFSPYSKVQPAKPDPLTLAFELQGVSTWRRNLSKLLVSGMLKLLNFLARHWLALMNTVNFLFIALAFGIPLAEGAGWNWLSKPLFAFCNIVCVQNPGHSFYLEGHQMALCQRCLAIYAVLGLLGLAFVMLRHRLKPLKFWQLVLFCVPIAIDGFTQMFGWRESTWELRFLTGGLFALGIVWYLYPSLEVWFGKIKIWVSRNRQQLKAAHA